MFQEKSELGRIGLAGILPDFFPRCSNFPDFFQNFLRVIRRATNQTMERRQ